MPPADNTPDFDKMTPEEIMTWMESLAKKQGASEGFTTSADMQIADIDPTTVVIDEPGYVPSEGKMKGKKIETVMPSKPSPAVPTPAVVEPPPQETFPPPIEQPAAALPPQPEITPILEPESANQGSMSWLESLAADQGVEFPSLDLLAGAADLAPAAPATPTANPVDWLENLAQSEGVVTDETPTKEPANAGDPMAWLESLAKRQGANDEELMTEANLDVPLPESAQVDGPGYTDYSFDLPGTSGKIGTGEHAAVSPEPAKELEPAALEDPSAWLDSLASGEEFETASTSAQTPAPGEGKMTDAEIQAALASGAVVPHDQMEAWMNRQLEIGAQRSEPEELSAYDPDAPAVPAELPDWLLDQVGNAPPVDETPQPTTASEPPPLLDTIFEPPAVADMPDWLKEEPESSELDSIFANTLEEDAPVIPPPPQETFAPPPLASEPVMAQTASVDTTDPWVEAFEIEYKERQGDTRATPTPVTSAAAFLELEDANLEPERELPVGEPEAVPDWLQGMVPGGEEAAVPADIPDWLKQDVSIAEPEPAVAPTAAGVPDWLQTVDVEPTDIPDWLKSTLGTSEQAVVTPEAAPSAPAAAVVPPAPPAIVPAAPVVGYSPAPVPVQATQIDVQATLNEARSRANVNDIDASLKNYEQLIRANVELDAVVDDVNKLLEKFKTTPAVYRVLGDALMRQGKLQLALDTYRKALNQL